MHACCTTCKRLRHIGQLLDGRCGECCCVTRNGAIAWMAAVANRRADPQWIALHHRAFA